MRLFYFAFTAVLSTFTIAWSGTNAASIDRMFETLEPALTTMAGAEQCGLRLKIGKGLWSYAEARVKKLEEESGLSAKEIIAKRQVAREEGQQIVAIGACDSVLFAFQIFDEIRKVKGDPYPNEYVEPKPSGQQNVPASPEKIPSRATTRTDIQSLEKRWINLNEECRGNSGDDPKTWEACDQRAAVTDQLIAIGYCKKSAEEAVLSDFLCDD